ncbi:MAG: hypothetical protein ACREJN_16195 [Nitrospiraceae bacterium]
MTEIVPAQTMVKTRAEAITMINPLRPLVAALVVDTPEDYEKADALLSRVMTARRWWLGKMNPIVEPIKKGLDLLYDLRNEFDKPLKADEDSIKGKMKNFKVEEARQLRIENEKRQAAIDEERRQADEKLKKAEMAKSKPMREKLVTQAAELEQSALMKSVEGPATGVKAASSSVRVRRKATVVNLHEFIKGILSGAIPDECIVINQTEINAAFSIEPETVSGWPGVEIIDDINISGRR